MPDTPETLEPCAWVLPLRAYLGPYETRGDTVHQTLDEAQRRAESLGEHAVWTIDDPQPLCRIADAQAIIDRLRAELGGVRERCAKADRAVEQTLGAALGYPRHADDKEVFPNATKADGVCVGDNTPETLAEQAAKEIYGLREELRLARRKLAEQQETMDRWADCGIGTSTHVENANAFWERIDSWRAGPDGPLSMAEQRELAEWWAELHTRFCRMDEETSQVRQLLLAATGERDRLRAIVARLPETEDRVTVVPCRDTVWFVIDGRPEEFAIRTYDENRGWIAHMLRWDMDRNIEVSNCYSTEQAASEAAKGKSDD